MILRGTIPSAVLGMDTGITIITPGTYHLEALKERAGRPYKTAYLLHGLYGNHGSWADNTMLLVYANDYHMVFIMPEAARSFYTDMAYGLNYFTYISEELPLICSSLFQISSDRNDTFVIGGSMGGYGALKCSLFHPDIFGHCLALSSAYLFLKEDLRGMRQNRLDHNCFRQSDLTSGEGDVRLLQDMRAAFGEKLECKEEDDLLSLLDSRMKEKRNLPDIRMICGKEDPYLEENRRFAGELNKRAGLAFSYKEIPGSHDWYYFNEALRTGLSECF